MEKIQEKQKIDELSQHERCKIFLTNRYDTSTKIMSLLFIKNELSRLKQSSDILSLRNTIDEMIDYLVDH